MTNYPITSLETRFTYGGLAANLTRVHVQELLDACQDSSHLTSLAYLLYVAGDI